MIRFQEKRGVVAFHEEVWSGRECVSVVLDMHEHSDMHCMDNGRISSEGVSSMNKIRNAHLRGTAHVRRSGEKGGRQDCDGLAMYGDECSMRYKGANDAFFDTGAFDFYAYDQPLKRYQIPKVTSSTPDVEIKVQDMENVSFCCTLNVEVDKQTLPNNSCQGSLTSDSTVMPEVAKYLNDWEAFIGCDVVGNDALFNMSQHVVTWYYNCNLTLPEKVRVDGAQLVIERVDYALHPGVYSCLIEHEGQTRFIRHQSICIENGQDLKTRISVTCDQGVYLVDLDSTLDVECNVGIRDNDVSTLTYNMLFHRITVNGTKDLSKDSISCTDFLESDKNRTVSTDDARISCVFFVVKQDALKCFDYTPTQEQWLSDSNKITTSLKMSYRIEQVSKSDLGFFRALASIEGGGNDSTIFVIKEDPNTPEVAVVVGGVVGGIVLLLGVAAILYWYRLEIRFSWRRSRCVSYEKNHRRWAAYLACAFDNDNVRERENLARFLDHVGRLLKRIHCPVYNPEIEPQQYQWDTENIREVQRICDRVLVLLTPRFLQEVENDFQLFANPDAIFVFITTPDTNTALKEIENDRQNALREHLRRHFVIRWNGETESLSKRFEMELELAMPKRRDEQIVVYENGNVTVQENGRV